MDVVYELDAHGHKKDIEAPDVGMKFDTKEAVYDIYKTYTKSMGFPIRTRSTIKDKNGIEIAMVMERSRVGTRGSKAQNQLKPQLSMQTGCGARIRVRTTYNGSWEISKISLQHSHPMSPTKARLFRCNRRLTPQIRR
ncbi:unnamed protein product [Cuscuta europaea]|uniref:FAR1 domain-containing protein n=1 Tax=Cuscuta europaea TaxID=41803 RepID=A0A9P0ZYB4_CUSEU|nr:unnamed protein product [Cuscuta europaea]